LGERTETRWKIVFVEVTTRLTKQDETNGTENMPVVQKGEYDIAQERNSETAVKKLLCE